MKRHTIGWFAATACLAVLTAGSLYAQYRGEHPFESGERHNKFKEWHQYRIRPAKPISQATVKVRASAPHLWVCAVGACKDRSGQYQDVCVKGETPGSAINGWNTLTLQLRAPEGPIEWMTITIENRYIPNSEIVYYLDTF